MLDGVGSGRIKSYDAASDLESGYVDDVTDAAGAYFAQDRYPNALSVARWVDADTNSELLGGAPAALATLTAITDGSFSFAGEDFDGLDLSAATDLEGVATALQAEIRTAAGNFATATATYSATDSRFEVSLDPAETPTFFGANSGGTGTDISANLGLTEATGADLILGSAAQSLTDALNAIRQVDNDFFVVVLSNDHANEVSVQSELITWAAANSGLAITDVSGDAALVANETTSNAAQIAARASNASIVNWSNTLDYKSMSVAGFICSRDLDQPRSAYTLKFKQLSGRTADTLTTAQLNELDRKNINAYVRYQGSRSWYVEGKVTGNYTWIDIPVYATWLSERMQADIVNYITSPDTKIAQTNEGIVGLLGEMDAVCIAAVNNGGVAPGKLTARQRQEIISITGLDDFDGELTSGFLNYISPLSSQREGRSSPPAYSWVKLSGAIHDAVIGVRVEQ